MQNFTNIQKLCETLKDFTKLYQPFTQLEQTLSKALQTRCTTFYWFNKIQQHKSSQLYNHTQLFTILLQHSTHIDRTRQRFTQLYTTVTTKYRTVYTTLQQLYTPLQHYTTLDTTLQNFYTLYNTLHNVKI